jgi:S1-C subfamily serine protease
MRRAEWLIGGAGFVGGVVACLVAVALLAPDSWRYKTMTRPVGIVPAGAEKHGYLGATFSNEPSRSLYIVEVWNATREDSAHVMVGDCVTSINGHPVAAFAEFQEIIADSKPGDAVELGVVRDQQPMTLKGRLLSLSEVLAARDAHSGVRPAP